MEEKSALDKLRNGEKVLCPKCGKAFLKPYGTTCDKAHTFDCPECDFYTHYHAEIEIE